MMIKVCGMRNPENIQAVSQLPIDWMGFIFYPKSSRYVGEMKTIDSTTIEALPTAQKRVGVFVNASVQEIETAVGIFRLDFVQLHGSESPKDIEMLKASTTSQAFGIIKAFSVGEDFDFSQTKPYENLCDFFLFDTKGKLPGGTGLKFNWDTLQKYKGPISFLLSGGIGAEDTKAIQAFYHPKCVGIDINSRFEEKPGLKKVKLVEGFVQTLRTNIKN